MSERQKALIQEIARHLGVNISATDLQDLAYVSQAYADRERLYTDSLSAQIRTADALERLGAPLGVDRRSD